MIAIRRLSPPEVIADVDPLAEVLFDCVDGGASVSFMAPFTREDARAWFLGVVPELEAGNRALLAAYDGDALVGTVQFVHAWPPNQPHRADITKLLVHRDARGRGAGRLLMEAAEAAARADGKTLLVLDTVTDSSAYRLYKSLGWTEVGEIPDFALYPDGRLCATTVFYKRI
ncbi:MAG TPA: GNAT family N-acetyltransferase [Gaiellaceae bacterium]|nr:GNAT family N-acetyltransferase [Gaiellaceae bacterium]